MTARWNPYSKTLNPADGDGFIVHECSTDRLEPYHKQILSKLNKSLLEIDQHEDEKYYVHYREHAATEPITSTHRLILQTMIEDLYNPVTF